MSSENLCFYCGLTMKIDDTDNPLDISCVGDGIIFRATGNYGSSVFDPVFEEILQIVVCDHCVKMRVSRVKRLYNIKRSVTVETQPFVVEEK